MTKNYDSPVFERSKYQNQKGELVSHRESMEKWGELHLLDPESLFGPNYDQN